MTRHLDIDDTLFLRALRGSEFEAYAALLAEADALHHAEVSKQIPKLIKPANRARPSREDFFHALKDPHQMLDAAVVDEDVAGFIHAVVFDRAENRAHEANRVARIELIVVKETHRRAGIGRRLIERAQRWAITKQADALILNCYAFNIVAARLYEKTGFSVLEKMYAVKLV